MIKKILIALVLVFGVGAAFFMFASRQSSVVMVEHTFHAPIEKIWALWTDPESMKQWWSPKDYTAPLIKSDFRVGGSFLYAMRSPEGEVFYNAGKYTEISPHQKIVSTMGFADETGRMLTGDEIKVPGHWPNELTLTVEFQEADGYTHVFVQEAGVPLIMKLFSKIGWDQQFVKFEQLLQAK